MTMTLSGKQIPALVNPAVEAEFEALFEQHWDRLCRTLYTMVGDWAEAEDLVLEAFVQFYRRPPNERGSPGGWLYRVATNLALNALRAHKRRQQYEIQAGVEALTGHAGDPADAVEKRLEQQRVQHVLSALKPRSAQLLILRHSGLTYAELAEALSLAPASVGTLLARAEKAFESLYTGGRR